MNGPPPWWPRRSRAELAALRLDLYNDGLLTDLAAGQIERRIAAMEELAAARWPRSLLVRRRLARDLRASVARYRWAGPDFRSRRIQAISDEWGEPPITTKASPPMPLSHRPPGRHR